MKRGAVLTIYGKIGSEMGKRITNSLEQMSEEPPPHLSLVLNSNGGCFATSFLIRMALDTAPMPVEGIVFGRANSSCFSILQHCTHRSAMADATLAHHAPNMIGWRVDNPKYDENLQLLRNLFEWELTKFSKRSGQPIERWREWTSTERRFTAEEALDLGIIDTILYRVPESLKENL